MLATYYGLYFTSPLEWYHQHIIGHHAYPNIPHRDPDLYHNGAMERHTKTLRWRPMHAHQARSWVPIWVIGTAAMCFLKPLQMFLTGQYNRAVAVMTLSRGRWLQHLAGRILAFFLCYLWPFFVMPAGRACLFAFLPIAIVSFCFMASSQINHLTDENIDQFSDDYYKQQVLTGHTCAPKSFLTFLFTGGLNLQIEHHLFPTLNHCHLRALQPMVKAVCKKHNVPYHESPSFAVAIGKYIQHLRTLSKKD
jgi:delta11-fatty-acid desaturase